MKNVTMRRLGGFTLIELLVVVLIIGILAAIALPQYEKAVEKSRVAIIYPVVKTLAEAEKSYYLANGSYTCDFSQLDISFNFGEPFSEKHYNGQIQGQKNQEWKIGCLQQAEGGVLAIRALRITGKYPLWIQYLLVSIAEAPAGWYCVEDTTRGGTPCQQLLGIPASQRVVANWYGRWYKMGTM